MGCEHPVFLSQNQRLLHTHFRCFVRAAGQPPIEGCWQALTQARCQVQMDQEVGTAGSDAVEEGVCLSYQRAEKSSAIVCRFGFCERNESSSWVTINRFQTSSVEQGKATHLTQCCFSPVSAGRVAQWVQSDNRLKSFFFFEAKIFIHGLTAVSRTVLAWSRNSEANESQMAWH